MKKYSGFLFFNEKIKLTRSSSTETETYPTKNSQPVPQRKKLTPIRSESRVVPGSSKIGLSDLMQDSNPGYIISCTFPPVSNIHLNRRLKIGL